MNNIKEIRIVLNKTNKHVYIKFTQLELESLREALRSKPELDWLNNGKRRLAYFRAEEKLKVAWDSYHHGSELVITGTGLEGPGFA